MAILELTLSSTYFNQECLNRFHYIASGTPAAVSFSFGLVSAFGAIWDNQLLPPAYPPDTLLQAILFAQNDGVEYTQINSVNLYDDFDFYETPFVPQPSGGGGGDGLPPFNAYGFRTNRVRRDIRRGFKRFVGAQEGGSGSGGVITQATMDAALIPLASKLGETLVYVDEGQNLTYQPAILGLEKYTEIVNGVEVEKYRRYLTEAEQMQHVATSIVWEPYTTIRSQNSRQYGRGR